MLTGGLALDTGGLLGRDTDCVLLLFIADHAPEINDAASSGSVLPRKSLLQGPARLVSDACV